MNGTRYEHSAEMGWEADCKGGAAQLIFGGTLTPEDLPDDMPSVMRAYVRKLLMDKPCLDELQKYLDQATTAYATAHRWQR